MSLSFGPPRSLEAHEDSEEKFRHLTYVTAGFHICDHFHICNRFTFISVWGPSNVKMVINVKTFTNVERITVIVFESTHL